MTRNPTVTAAQTALEAGEAALKAGDFGAADDALRGALATAGPPLLRAAVLDALVRLALDLGQDLAAERWLYECESLRTEHAGEISVEAGRSWVLRARFHVLARQDHKAAADAWQRAARLLLGSERAIAMLGLATARLESGQLDLAEAALAQARIQVQSGGEDALLADIEALDARRYLALDQPTRALDHIHQRVALVHRLHGPDSREMADTLLLLTTAAEAGGDIETAVSAMGRAVEVLGRVLGSDDAETQMAAAYLLALRARLGIPPSPSGLQL